MCTVRRGPQIRGTLFPRLFDCAGVQGACPRFAFASFSRTRKGWARRGLSDNVKHRRIHNKSAVGKNVSGKTPPLHGKSRCQTERHRGRSLHNHRVTVIDRGPTRSSAPTRGCHAGTRQIHPTGQTHGSAPTGACPLRNRGEPACSPCLGECRPLPCGNRVVGVVGETFGLPRILCSAG